MGIITLVVAMIVVDAYGNTQQGGERLGKQIGAEQMAMNDLVAASEDEAGECGKINGEEAVGGK